MINVRGEEVSFMSSARQGENFAMEQQKDQDIKWIRELMKKHGTHKPEKVAIGNKDRKIYFREYDNLEIKNNLLYRLYEDNQAREFAQLVLPKSSLQRVIEESHSRKSSGHLGSLKTFKKLRKRFFSPCLKKDIKYFVKKCEVCCLKNKVTASPFREQSLQTMTQEHKQQNNQGFGQQQQLNSSGCETKESSDLSSDDGSSSGPERSLFVTNIKIINNKNISNPGWAQNEISGKAEKKQGPGKIKNKPIKKSIKEVKLTNKSREKIT